MERYEAEANASLRRYYPGTSLDAVWRGEISVDECWGLLMQLPRDSPLKGALAADPDFVSDAEPGPPPWTEFGPEIATLAGIHDMLGSLVSMVAGLGGQKIRIAPHPRPVNLAEQKRRAEQWARHRALTARLIPRKEG